MLFLKGNSNSKHFSFFVFYFDGSNKISSIPPRLLNFQEFSNPCLFQPPSLRLLSFEELSNLPAPRLFQPPSSTYLLGTQEYLLDLSRKFVKKNAMS